MKKLGLLTVVAFTAVLSFAVVASAQPSGLYFTPKIGYSYLSADKGFVNIGSTDKASKGRVMLGLAAGYDFNSVYEVPIRAEFEYAWRGKKDWGTGFIEDAMGQPRLVGQIALVNEVGVQSLFANFYFDIHNSTPITPYIGGGLGMARIESDNVLIGYRWNGGNLIPVMMETTSTNFAWNIGAGAAWAINDNVSLDVGYRYADFGAVEYKDPWNTQDIDITTHEVLMGLRYTF